jgi:hypothetical protein
LGLGGDEVTGLEYGGGDQGTDGNGFRDSLHNWPGGTAVGGIGPYGSVNGGGGGGVTEDLI